MLIQNALYMQSFKIASKFLLLKIVVFYSLHANALNIDTIFIREEKMSLASEASTSQEQAQAANHEQKESLKNNSRFLAGDKIFVEIEVLKPTILRKSTINVVNKIARSKGIVFDNGKSMYGIEDAIPVFKGFDGNLYLIDGHHKVLASMESKAKSVPVLVLDDLSDLPEEKFWEAAIAKNYAYLYNMNGEQQLPPKSFNDLIDDSLSYFASITSFKCATQQPSHQKDFNKNLDNPLWIKTVNSQPFIEFTLANELYKKKFQFVSQDRLSKDRLDSKIEEARKLLFGTSIEGAIILPKNKEATAKLCKEQCAQIGSSMSPVFGDD
jgi:hypothetical protein